jgi:hypothetical protein
MSQGGLIELFRKSVEVAEVPRFQFTANNPDKALRVPCIGAKVGEILLQQNASRTVLILDHNKSVADTLPSAQLSGDAFPEIVFSLMSYA